MRIGLINIAMARLRAFKPCSGMLVDLIIFLDNLLDHRADIIVKYT